MNRKGLCCIHVGLQKSGSKFQTMTWSRFSQIGRTAALPILAERYKNNLSIILKILHCCAQKGWCYRVSSDIFPLMTHPEANLKWEDIPNHDELTRLFLSCAKEIYTNNIRVSCHPDQFNVLASLNDKSVAQTITELNHHGWFMERLDSTGYHSPINIHLNCSSGDPKEIAKRFKDGLDRLDKHTKPRLVIENEDKGIWNVRNLIEHIHELTGVPITFDYLHHKCNDGGLTEKEAFELCIQTWGKTRPLFHFSESLPGQKNLRKHADYPTYVPDTYGYEIDLDYEFKQKDLALERAEKIAQNLAGEELQAKL